MREEKSARALSTRIFALISLVRLACKRERQTEKERENRVKRGLYICVCVKRMKRKTLIKSSIRVRLKRKLLKKYYIINCY